MCTYLYKIMNSFDNRVDVYLSSPYAGPPMSMIVTALKHNFLTIQQ